LKEETIPELSGSKATFGVVVSLAVAGSPRDFIARPSLSPAIESTFPSRSTPKIPTAAAGAGRLGKRGS
jgi:hypothetical protein